MQLSIEHIETTLAGTVYTPRQLASFRVYLAAIHSLRGTEMAGIESRKARVWLDIRATAGSVAEANHAWDTTADGQRQIELKWELRRIDKLIQAIASMLRVMEQEARNQV
jgi:hypothetical protein